MRDIAGSTVWITGAGRGIGQAMAKGFARAGCTVAITARTESMVEAVARDLNGHAFVGDTRDRARMDEIANLIAEKTGRLDIVCNNAGATTPHRTWDDIVVDEWDRVIDVNIKGAINVIAASLPIMRHAGGGLIINTSSWAGRFHYEKSGVPYGSTKHALNELSRSLNSSEGKNGIRSCALCPAEVATELLKGRPGWTPALSEGAIQPDDMADAALFVARINPNVAVHEITLSPVRR